MNIIRIIVEEHVEVLCGETRVLKAEKAITREEYDKFTWFTMAEVFGLTVANLDEKITEEKRKLEIE